MRVLWLRHRHRHAELLGSGISVAFIDTHPPQRSQRLRVDQVVDRCRLTVEDDDRHIFESRGDRETGRVELAIRALVRRADNIPIDRVEFVCANRRWLGKSICRERRNTRNLEVALIAGRVARIENRRRFVDNISPNAHKRFVRTANDRQTVPYPQVRHETLARVILNDVAAQPGKSSLQTHPGEFARLLRPEFCNRFVYDINRLCTGRQSLREPDRAIGLSGKLLFIPGLVVCAAFSVFTSINPLHISERQRIGYPNASGIDDVRRHYLFIQREIGVVEPLVDETSQQSNLFTEVTDVYSIECVERRIGHLATVIDRDKRYTLAAG